MDSEKKRQASENLRVQLRAKYGRDNPLTDSDADLEGDIAAFITYYAVPLLDHEAAEVNGLDRLALKNVLQRAAQDIIEDILPDRSLEVNLCGLEFDELNPDGSERHEVQVGSRVVYRVLPDGTRVTASEADHVVRASHGEWENQLTAGSFVRGRDDRRNRRIRDELGAALNERICYWIGLNLTSGPNSPWVTEVAKAHPTSTPKSAMDSGRGLNYTTLNDLASKSNVSLASIKRARRGENLKVENRAAIAKVVGCRPDDLLWPNP